MLHLPITGLYAGLLAILFIAHSFNVIRMRLKFRVGIGVGDKNQKPLAKMVRIHGNFAEYIPLALILLAITELNGLGVIWLHLSGATLFIGRILHAMGLNKSIGTSKPRQIGMLSCFVVILTLAVINICYFVFL